MRSTLAILGLALVGPMLAGKESETETDLFDGFRPSWGSGWKERVLGERRTRYEVVDVGGDASLRATSRSGASALWRELDIERPGALELRWRWKVETALRASGRERTKDGDDYSARLLVSFGAGDLGERAPTLCYVWAAGELVGSRFPNPYRSNVITIVLQSGDSRIGEWVRERRDLIEDFEAAFGGGRPDAVTGVAVVVDTDDTEGVAVSWFDDLRLRVSPN